MSLPLTTREYFNDFTAAVRGAAFYFLMVFILLILAMSLCGCGTPVNETSSKNNTLTVIQLFQGGEIAADDYHIYLGHRPVVSSESVVIEVNGKNISPEVDYVFPTRKLDVATGFYITSPEAKLAYICDRTDPSDGYQTGTIKILKPDLIPFTAEVTVTYTYYKSIVNKYVGTGEGTVDLYYLEGIKNIVPGSEIVQLSEQSSSTVITLTRNSSFEPDAGDYGYTFNYNKDNPSLSFNKAVSSSENFSIWFQKYVP
jgi:hypothetical protein